MENPFDDTSDFDVVFLSARITQIEDKMLKEIQGWLQTENQTSTIRKQEAVRRTIRMAYLYLQTQLAHMDEEPITESVQVVDNSPEPEKPEKPVNNLSAISSKPFDMKAYAEFSNKSTYTPRTQNAHSTRATEIQRRLGLGIGT